MSFAPSSAGTESRDSVEPLPLFSLKDLLPDPPTLRERIWRRAELKWFDEAIKPFLYRLVRYELEIPGGLSATRNYWISPRLGFKTDLRTGILYSLETGNRVGYYFDLWMCGKGYTRWNFPAPKKSLQAWILKQQAENPEPESRLFTEEVAELEWIFFYVMFLRGPLEKGTGTARLLWEGFRLLFGPVRTRRLFDFSTHHQRLRFLRYAADHPNPLFSVRKISGPKKKEEVWEIRDRGFNVIKAEFAPTPRATPPPTSPTATATIRRSPPKSKLRWTQRPKTTPKTRSGGISLVVIE